MRIRRWSIVIVSPTGVRIDPAALHALPIGGLVEVEWERSGGGVAAVLTVASEEWGDAIRERFTSWARARGWWIAVAPLPGTG